jgi:hypothetical protein
MSLCGMILVYYLADAKWRNPNINITATEQELQIVR